MRVKTDSKTIKNLLNRGTEDVLVKENLEKRLKSGERLIVKLGIDPTSPEIHLGRAVSLWKVRQFQDLGHQIVIIIGDFTARIGDPSDKLNKRPMLSKEEIYNNMMDYKKLLGKIINTRKAKFVYNSKWLSKMRFEDIIDLAEVFTVNQMSSRRNFKERMDKGEEVSLREFLYPLMQGYDSYILGSDVEVGGFDQLFNLKAGRTIQKHLGQQQQDILTTKMLTGTDGRKMSSSWGNVVSLSMEPNDMFGKLMSLNDDLISEYMLLCTDISENDIKKDVEDMQKGKVNPKDVKIKLSREIVALYHGSSAARDAEDEFVKTFSDKKIPKKIKQIKVKQSEKLSEVLLKNEIVSSKSEWDRLVKSGSVKILKDDEKTKKITDRSYIIDGNISVQIGKRKFVKIVL